MLAIPALNEAASRRFWEKVSFGHGPGSCWLWCGQRTRRVGYGRFYLEGHGFRAHRVAYSAAFGDIPDGLTIDHLCRNTACVNPSHMEPVTNKENVLRGEGRTAVNARKTECKNGHPFDEQNTIHVPGGRRCRICANRLCAEYRERVAARNPPSATREDATAAACPTCGSDDPEYRVAYDNADTFWVTPDGEQPGDIVCADPWHEPEEKP